MSKDMKKTSKTILIGVILVICGILAWSQGDTKYMYYAVLGSFLVAIIL